MRSALIAIDGQPRDAGGKTIVGVAGKSLARRQLDFALAAGAEQVILLGDGITPGAVELRHTAEAAGAKVLTAGNGHGLLGAVRAADHLLVLAPGVLPEAPIVLEMLGKGSALLVLPAAQGISAGFERIDAERAWAGALVVQGGLVERLAELPPDIDPAAALLRIALQAKVAERRLPETLLADGSWAMLTSSAEGPPAERAWLKRNLPQAPRNRLSRWLAMLALRPLATRMLEQGERTPKLLAGAALVLLIAGVALSAVHWAAAGLLLVALGVFVCELSSSVNKLMEAPFGPGKHSRLLSGALRLAADLSLTVCAMLAIEQSWLHRLFPPLVLLGLLHILRPRDWPGWNALIGDRLVLAAVLAVAAALGLAEPAVMALVLIVIVLKAAQSLER